MDDHKPSVSISLSRIRYTISWFQAPIEQYHSKFRTWWDLGTKFVLKINGIRWQTSFSCTNISALGVSCLLRYVLAALLLDLPRSMSYIEIQISFVHTWCFWSLSCFGSRMDPTVTICHQVTMCYDAGQVRLRFETLVRWMLRRVGNCRLASPVLRHPKNTGVLSIKRGILERDGVSNFQP